MMTSNIEHDFYMGKSYQERLSRITDKTGLLPFRKHMQRKRQARRILYQPSAGHTAPEKQVRPILWTLFHNTMS